MARQKSFADATEKIGVIYARYSSHNQKEESIEQQVEECMAFAALNHIKIIQVYSDKALSGKTDKRPQFQKMMRDAEKRQFTVVVAYKSNRIARNMLNALSYEDKLGRFGIETLYAKEEFGNTAAGRFALRTMMNVNQFYSENMAEDIRRGMRDNAENCKVNGAIPLGYVRGPDGRYAIEPTEAAIVREIYKRVLEGESFVDIANDLNGRGIKTKRKGLWNKNSFHRLLANDNYIGVYRHSGYVNELGIPPILEKEVFYAMQRHLDTKKNPRGRHRENNDYLLTGKLHCGYCKSFMVGISGTSKTGDKHYYYTCNDRRTGGSCKKENVRKDYIEQTVAELTQRFILQDEVIEWIAASAMEVLAQSSSEAEIAAMESELAADRKAAKNIMNAIEQGIFTAMTKDRLLELELDISTLEKSIALARAASEETVMEKERIIWTLEQLRDGDVTSKDYQKRLFDTFVKAVYLWDDKIEVHYYYSGEKNVLTSSLKEAAGGGGSGPGGVLINSPMGHQKPPKVLLSEVFHYSLENGYHMKMLGGGACMVYTLDEIAQRVRPVAEKYHLRAIYVFGSYARGEAREDSDVDLLIDDTNSGLRGLAYGGLCYDLEEALEKEISFILIGSLKEPCRVKSDLYFRENINRERRRIYAAA